MTRISSLLELIAVVLSIVPGMLAVYITNIFTVQNGNNDGGCGARDDVLDLWLSEGIESLVVAINEIDDYRNDIWVRRSMSVIFGITNNARRNTCPGTPVGELSFPALDFANNDILDQNSEPVPISAVPVYAEHLAEDPDNRPWWAGELTELHAYYFTEYGGNYCLTDDLGVTARSELLMRNAAGDAVPRDPDVASVIICPYAFDTSPRLNNYKDANNLIQDGTNLADAVPKSTTLLHEMFHAIGRIDFLAGDDEECAYPYHPPCPLTYIAHRLD
ncbi:hypothetical protein HD806DRAFT_527304 [Xylariaceae sp. AK1471]|nr:hypothetical protein HD806DRAFT_527304 [Xylariaceae sp. AK1471]